MNTVLVTAASGNAGRNCVHALLNKGYNVVATSRNPAQLSLPTGVEIRAYDADGVNDFPALFKGIDYLVLIGPPLDGLVYEKLVPLIEAAAEHGLARIVYLSGNYLSGMTGETLAALPIRKIERKVAGSGLPFAIVRAGFFMDNYTTGFYGPMVRQGELRLATGHGKSALIAGADAALFVAEVLHQELSGEYIVTGPEALDHFEVAALLSEKEGRKISYTPISEEQLAQAYAERGLPDESADYGKTLYRAFRHHATAAITDGFSKVTGREPISLRTFLGLG
ncbi:NmrA family NAD(P)-binding protein [Duganella aceris]|uniref:NmrA family NAD(P)-binding protein n=1 Tax=Duganella aceris TaxID=2703883 RepID=A0ABX0FKG3_9BURK|nr:NmrA family NAD(P)-binding protein [Duganella aceris]NGZ85074.1 NmrA family NAD(P)-binding protein [Duganella aceris]